MAQFAVPPSVLDKILRTPYYTKPGQDRSCPGRGYGDWNQAMVSRRSAMLSILLTAAAAVMDMTLPETEI